MVTTYCGACAMPGTVLIISAASRAHGAAVLIPTAPVRRAGLGGVHRALADLELKFRPVRPNIYLDATLYCFIVLSQ